MSHPQPTAAHPETAFVSNALSVDVEDYFQVSNLAGVIERSAWSSLESRAGDSTRQLLDLFDETGQRATFFTLGWIAERDPELIREIVARGHELASHGYGHELVYEIGPERFREDLRRSSGLLEDAAGVAVRGYRAPSYSITTDSLWALDILVEQGFTFDSSIFPIHHHRYGIPGFPRHPVRLALPGGGEITEFPMTTMPLGSLNLPLSGGAYLRFLPGVLFNLAWDRLVARQEPTVLYVHPWEIDADQPRQPVGWKTHVNHYYNLKRTLKKLHSVLDRHPFASLGSVLGGLAEHDRLPQRALSDLIEDEARSGGPRT